jgi:subtilisin family serine protease
MSSPHIAGIAALVASKHPTWSAAAVRSALLTSARNVTNRGAPLDGTPFDYGAGMVYPKASFRPRGRRRRRHFRRCGCHRARRAPRARPAPPPSC